MKTEEQAIKSEIQQIIVGYLNDLGVSQRDFAKLTGVSDAAYSTYRRMKSAMGIDVLDKILVAYPNLRKVLAKYLTGSDTSEAREGMYRKLIEENTIYTLMPRKLLDDYDVLPKSESENRGKLIEIVTAAMDQTKTALIAKYEAIIEGYERQIKSLEGEAEALNKELEDLRNRSKRV